MPEYFDVINDLTFQIKEYRREIMLSVYKEHDEVMGYCDLIKHDRKSTSAYFLPLFSQQKIDSVFGESTRIVEVSIVKVFEEFCRKGLGRKLITKALRFSSIQGFEQAFLFCSPDKGLMLRDIKRFYTSLGFVEFEGDFFTKKL